MEGRQRIDIESVWRAESRRVLASLIRLLGDFDLAEEALNEAFLAAAEQWPRDGIPQSPRAWLVSAGRFKAIDRIRRKARFERAAAAELVLMDEAELAPEAEAIADDRLRLIFICCHPALPVEAQIAMTLREACGLTTEEIAAAFLSKPSAIAQRIVRAKNRIRELKLAYEVPEPAALRERLDRVLHVVYLIFSEGYAASQGDSVVRGEMSGEAIRLCRLLQALTPSGDIDGLLSLMLLQDSRNGARTRDDGTLILLAEQDRALWDRGRIAEGMALLARAFAQPPVSTYTIEAAIAAEHARAAQSDDTDWAKIAGLYEVLRQADASPVVALNHAVAVAMRDGPDAGLALIAKIEASGALAKYRYLYAAKADLLRRAGRKAEAVEAYEQALLLTSQGAERRFLAERIAEPG